MMDQDPMIEDVVRARRHRTVLVVAAVIGIVAGALLGLGASLVGVIGEGGPHNPGMLVCFVAPFAASMAIGYAIYGVLRWRARPVPAVLPRATLHRG